MATKNKRGLTPEERLRAALVPESEWLYEVPENWRWTRIETIARMQSGKNIKAKEISEIQDDGHPYECFGGNGIRGYVATYNNAGRFPIVGRQGALCGNVNMADGLFYATEHAVVTTCNKGVNADWLFHALTAMNLNQYATATAQPGLAVGKIAMLPIALPPTAEQRRIVSHIDRLFSKLDDAEAVLREVIEGSERRRAAILHEAINGGLSKSWRILNNVDKDATWKECRLIDALRGKPRNGYSPKPVDYETPVRNLILSAVTSGTFRPEYFKYIDVEIPDDSHLWLMPGDILLQRSNSLEKVGTSALYTGKAKEFIYPDLMMKLQVNEAAYAPFIAYQLKSIAVMDYLRSNATGTAGNMPKVNQTTVSNIPVVLPSYKEQMVIAEALDRLLSKESALSEVANNALDCIASTRAAILARALRGKLGTNDPNDPDAETLLVQLFASDTAK